MTYLQARRRPYERRRTVMLSIALALIVVAVLIHLLRPHFFPAVFSAIARPFWRVQFSVNYEGLSSPESLLKYIQTLEGQLEDMKVRLDTISDIEEENSELKQLFGRTGREAGVDTDSNSTTTDSVVSNISNYTNPDGRILAAVLKKPPSLIYDELIIDVGSDHNLSTSSVVYAHGNILLGRVVDVLSTTARVRLFTSPGESFEVFIGGTNAPATAHGRGGGQYEAEVSRDIEVEEGDTVSNPSLNDRSFGIVSSVLIDPTEAFKTVLFSPPVNIYQLRWVLVKN